MTNILKKYVGTDKYFNIYTNVRDTSKFMYGKITAMDDYFFAASLVSPDGIFDGIVIMPQNSIIRIELSSEYQEKMNNVLCINKYTEEVFSITSDDVLTSGLQTAQTAKRVVSIELLESGVSDIIGFVNTIEDGVCKLSQVDEYGRLNGESYVRVDDISYVGFSSCDERRIEQLVDR